MNAAIERHVQTCQLCQREGLTHVATQKREAVRLSRKRSSRRDRTTPLRLLALVLTLILLVLLVLVASSRGIHVLP
jgi:predicted lysophospholipase L1 biosynthesis ABC-type transport system permease subunit